MEDGIQAYLTELRKRIDGALSGLISSVDPAPLYDSARYVLEGKGKRLRGSLVMMSAEMFGCEAERALPVALAMEVFHNFTLVHDDIMDSSDLRRGRETVHNRWDEPTAILCGDLLMGLSYDLLASNQPERLSRMLEVHNRTVRQLCEGQALDMMFEKRESVSVEEYLAMISLKTAALLQSSLVLGGLSGSADDEDLKNLSDVGMHIGIAFQIHDDLLDLTAVGKKWGKPVGGDLLSGKKTFLLLKALEKAEGEEHAWFQRIMTDGGLPAQDVHAAQNRMAQLGVLEEARTTVEFHSDRALSLCSRLPSGLVLEGLQYLIGQMRRRQH